tara:strand:+ start:7356 stop:7562 length:207 start_codon:yes stop_codon:yes gene_type:complete
MKHQEDKARLASLNEFIGSYFRGELDQVVRQLNETIYMLHYLDTEIFSEEERIEKAFLLHSMAEALDS